MTVNITSTPADRHAACSALQFGSSVFAILSKKYSADRSCGQGRAALSANDRAALRALAGAAIACQSTSGVRPRCHAPCQRRSPPADCRCSSEHLRKAGPSAGGKRPVGAAQDLARNTPSSPLCHIRGTSASLSLMHHQIIVRTWPHSDTPKTI